MTSKIRFSVIVVSVVAAVLALAWLGLNLNLKAVTTLLNIPAVGVLIAAVVAISLALRAEWREGEKEKRKKEEEEAAATAAAEEARQRKRAAIEKYQQARQQVLKGQVGVDAEFVTLSLLVPHWRDDDISHKEEAVTFESLDAVVQSKLAGVYDGKENFSSLVVLGDPGAGKSTLLNRFELESIRNTPDRLCFLFELNDYAGPKPMEWLAERLNERDPELGSINELMRERPVYLLLDALNEIPLGANDRYEALVDQWHTFLMEAKQAYPMCRFIFSCRDLQYSTSLSRKDRLVVPHVRVKPMSPTQIRAFLVAYAGQQSGQIYSQIEAARAFELYSLPMHLKIVIEHLPADGKLPTDRAAIFTLLARDALRRELEKPNPGGRPRVVWDFLADAAGAVQWAKDETDPYALPDGALFDAATNLAFAVQRGDLSQTQSKGELHFAKARVLEALKTNGATDPLHLCEALLELRLLTFAGKGKSGEPNAQLLKFPHQLIQEYYVGRRLASGGTPELAAVPWNRGGEGLNLENSNTDDVPPPLGTRWDEAMVFAALMSDSADAFVADLAKQNLPLAARCAFEIRKDGARSGGRALTPKAVDDLVVALGERMQSRAAADRARIDAGKALSQLRLPHLASHDGASAPILLPPMLKIEGGAIKMGARAPKHANENPWEDVDVSPFWIATHPVTNAEWQKFIDARGYQANTWWDGVGERWRRGDTTYQCWVHMWRRFRAWLQAEGDTVTRNADGRWVQGENGKASKLLKEGEISPYEAQQWIKWSRKDKQSDKEFEAFLTDKKEVEKRSQPTTAASLREPGFDNPLQPVCGITWFEAQAYCAWLNVQTPHHRWRLPTEAEWEVAARHGAADQGADYPWGDAFDATMCNTTMSFTRATTPVGLYPPTAAGLFDMCGNVFEWTSSIYNQKDFKYPYKRDAREAPQADDPDPANYADRVLRGGSWYYGKDYARTPFRLRYHPGFGPRTCGFRLARDA